MLVIISDLHLGDGTTAESIPASAFYLFAKRLRQDAHAQWDIRDLAVGLRAAADLVNGAPQGELVRLLPHIPLLEDSFRLIHRSDSPHEAALGELAEFLRGRPLT